MDFSSMPLCYLRFVGEEGYVGRVGGAGQVDQVVSGVATLLGGGAEHRHHATLGPGSSVAAVASARLAGNGGGPDALFGTRGGGAHLGVGEESEQGWSAVVEMINELTVLLVRVVLFMEQLDAFDQVIDDLLPLGLSMEVSGVESLAEHVAHLARCSSYPPEQAFDHLLASWGEVPNAGLMRGLPVADGCFLLVAVGGPPVVDDRAGVVGVDTVGGLVTPSAERDVVVGIVGIGSRGCQPFRSRVPVDPAHRFVHRRYRRRVDPGADLGGERHQIGGCKLPRLTEGADGHVESEPLREQPGALGERDPQAVVQPGHSRLDVGANLRGRRTLDVGGPLKVKPLDRSPAVLAPTDRYYELPGLEPQQGWQIRRGLLRIVLMLRLPTAIRAATRQRDLQGAVGVRRGLAILVTAGCLTTLVGRPLRLAAGLAVVEQRCLAPARPTRLFWQLFQLAGPGVSTRRTVIQLPHRRLERRVCGPQPLHQLPKTSRNPRQVPTAVAATRTRNEPFRSLGSARTITTRSTDQGGGSCYPMTIEPQHDR